MTTGNQFTPLPGTEPRDDVTHGSQDIRNTPTSVILGQGGTGGGWGGRSGGRGTRGDGGGGGRGRTLQLENSRFSTNNTNNTDQQRATPKRNAAPTNFRRGGATTQRRGQRLHETPKDRPDHAGVKMQGRAIECMVCCQKSDLFGIGACMHPACMECCIRIRIPGESPNKSCFTCRSEVETLYFVQTPRSPKSQLEIPSETVPHEDEEAFGIRFQNKYAIDCYESYTAHCCPVCAEQNNEASFPSLAALRQHLGQAHKMTYCRLCLDNLNVLTKDRKIYTKEQLEKHLDGKLDEHGFKGHPSCMFDTERFFDEDQRWRHLRREHYYCHLCEGDEEAPKNRFYRNMRDLNWHYRQKHHPCPEPDCLSAGIAFKTAFDLDFHRSKEHTSRGTVPINFTYARRDQGMRNDQAARQREAEERQAAEWASNEPPTQRRIVPSAQQGSQAMHIVPSQQYTSGAANPIPSNGGQWASSSIAHNLSSQQFPSFPPPQSNALPPPGFPAPPRWKTATARAQQQGSSSRLDEYPILQTASTVQAPAPTTLAALPSNPARNTVWGKGKTSELFKPEPPKPKVSPQTQPEPSKRVPVQPPMEVWPPQMQQQMRARDLGLPDPEEQRIARELEMKKEHRREVQRLKKQKSVTPLKASQLAADKLNTGVVPSNSRFSELANYDEEEAAATKDSRTKDRWGASSGNKSSGSTAPTLKPTSDGFSRIVMGNDDDEQQQENKLSLDSIARAISGERTTDEKGKEEETSDNGPPLGEEPGSAPMTSQTSSILNSLFSVPKKNKPDGM